MSWIDSSLVRGALAGGIATVPMTMTMARLFQSLPENQKTEPLPPGQIVSNLEDRAGLDPDRHTHETVTSVAHFAYGAGCGAIYGLLSAKWSARPLVKGSAFGLGIWAISYLGFLPATGLLPSALRQPKSRNFLMIVAHLIWGTALARLSQRSSKELVSEAVTSIAARGTGASWVRHALA